jgi:hypothetical protein
LFEFVSAKPTWNVVLRESIASFSDSFKNFHLKFVTYLKVLSSEIDLAENRLNRKAIIKERGMEVFRKIRPFPSCQISLKQQRHIILLLAIWRQSANGAHSSVSSLLFNI